MILLFTLLGASVCSTGIPGVDRGLLKKIPRFFVEEMNQFFLGCHKYFSSLTQLFSKAGGLFL
jgi:hypothetical protein